MEIDIEQLEGLIGEVAFVIGIMPLLVFSQWVLGPLAQIRKLRCRFTLGDVICLAVMILPCLAVLHLLAGADWREVLPLDFCGSTFAAGLWFAGVVSASTAGVRIPWHRAVAIMLVYPLNALGSLLVAGLWAASIADQISSSNSMPSALHVTFAVTNVLVLGAMLASKGLARKIAAASEPEPVASSPGTSGQVPEADDSRDPWATSGEDGQNHEGSDPEHRQDNREEK